MSVACAAGLVLYLNSSERKGRALITHIAATASPPIRDGDTIIVLRGNTLAESTYAGDRLEYLTGIRAGTFAFLLAPGIDATVEVEDDHTLLVRAKDRSLFDSAHHALTLPRGWKPRVGQAFDLRGLSVTIAETRADDFVSALRLRFRKPLSSDRIHFYPSQFAEAARPAPR
jgi:hypothetical protein